MFIFLDDLRPCPPGAVLCRTAQEAMAHIDTGQVTRISLDHDLGTELTGYDVAKHIELLVAEDRIPCPAWSVHSANPVGRQRIEAAMQSALRLCEERTRTR